MSEEFPKNRRRDCKAKAGDASEADRSGKRSKSAGGFVREF